jgi:hypothetical protein
MTTSVDPTRPAVIRALTYAEGQGELKEAR